MLIEIMTTLGLANSIIALAIIAGFGIIVLSWIVFFVSRAWHRGIISANK